MLRMVLSLVAMTAVCSAGFAQYEDIPLEPGVTLLSVDGVPVNQMAPQVGQRCVGGQCMPAQSQCVPGQGQCGLTQGPRMIQPIRPMARARGGYPPIIGQGTPAYQHALREAEIIAARGGTYHRHSDGGHPLGCAPGTKYSGTGFTWDMNRPGHCWEDELPESRIVARARARGVNGAWFWSAHYR